MTLTAKDVAEITRLLEASNFDELYLEMEGLKLSLRRGSAVNGQSLGEALPIAQPQAPEQPMAPSPARGPADAAAPAPPASPQVQRASPAAAPVPASAPDPDAVDVLAPLLGTFYRAPKPGAPPYVEVGSQVEEDTIIGIIEVMKLMNTVRAGVRGKVTQILGRDGSLVEYGELLMRVSR